MALPTILNAQITLDNVQSISIRDEVNWNYERIQTCNFEVRFNDQIELWYTKQITQAEYEQTVNKSTVEQLNKQVLDKRRLGLDSFRFYIEQSQAVRKAAYQAYCDTISSKFITNIKPAIIQSLLTALQREPIPKTEFDVAELEPGGDYPLGIVMTSYYPLVGVTVISNEQDTVVVYCRSQGDLTLPWTLKDHETETFNTDINWALHAILPDEKNINKKRLIQGLPK